MLPRLFTIDAGKHGIVSMGWNLTWLSDRKASKRCRAAGLVAFALHPLTQKLARTPDGFGLLTGASFGRLLVAATKLHLAEYALALHLFLQGAEGLVDIVVANADLHGLPIAPFRGVACCGGRDKTNRPTETGTSHHLRQRNRSAVTSATASGRAIPRTGRTAKRPAAIEAMLR